MAKRKSQPPAPPAPPTEGGFEIAPQAIVRWTSIPQDADLALHIKRRDFDNLFFAIQKTVTAHSELLLSFAAQTRGETPVAQDHYDRSVALSKVAMDHLGQMMDAVMRHAEVIDAQ